MVESSIACLENTRFLVFYTRRSIRRRRRGEGGEAEDSIWQEGSCHDFFIGGGMDLFVVGGTPI